MAISEETIQEMRQVLKEEYGKDFTYAETSEILKSLTGYFDLLARIHHRMVNKNDYDNKTKLSTSL